MTLDPKTRSEIYHDNVEKADCSVIALRDVAGLSYDRAEEILLSYSYGGGKASGTGTTRGDIERALRMLGFETRYVPVDPGTTPASFWMDRPAGTFLIYTHKHVGSFVGGQLQNFHLAWNANVEKITEVIK